MKLRERLQTLRRTYPLIGPARYLHARRADLRRSGRSIVLLIVVRNDDGRMSVHRTQFTKQRAMTVPQWADWIEANAPDVLSNQVLAYLNRTFGSIWSIDRVIGWHFV